VRRVTPAGLARGGAVTAAGLAFPLLVTAPYLMTIAIFTVMYAALATSWNLLGGFSGYLSLGHAAFFGVGAYAEAILFTHVGIGGGYRPFAVVPLIGLGVAVAAIPVAIVFLRVRGATFAIVTISLLFIVQLLAFNLRSITNGAQGMSMPIPPFAVATYERPFYYGMLAVFLGSALTCWIVSTGKLGLMLFAIRDDEDRAHGLGIRVSYAKVTAFCVSAGLFAMPGAIWAYYEGFIYPQFAVDPLVTIGAVLMAFLGGRGTIWGPMLGALILVPAQQYLAYSQGASQLYLVGYSAVFLVIMLLMPRGIIPSVRDLAVSHNPFGRQAGDGESPPRTSGVAT
jgi:branched-chain amino acid transport system permease protein